MSHLVSPHFSHFRRSRCPFPFLLLGALGVLMEAGCGSLADGSSPPPQSDASPAATNATEGGPDGSLSTTNDAAPGDAGSEGSGPPDGARADADATTSSSDAADADGPPSSSEAGEGATPAEGGDADPPEGGSPANTAAPHLRLWLTADRGVTCSSGRVTRWADQSAHGDDATLENGQLGPQCGAAPGPHAVGTVALPYFSGPGTNVVDETLDVDLSFLVNTSYTIFAVERRWSDYPDGTGTAAELFLGSTLTTSRQLGGGDCSTGNEGVALGYIYYKGTSQLSLDQLCDSVEGDAVHVPSPPPAPLSEDTVVFDATRGHELWLNGAPISVSSDTNPVTMAPGGAIGRAYTSVAGAPDDRFHGDIAEIVIYDSPLEDSDRAVIEAYLQRHWGY